MCRRNAYPGLRLVGIVSMINRVYTRNQTVTSVTAWLRHLSVFSGEVRRSVVLSEVPQRTPPPDLRSEKFLLLSDQGYTGLSLVTGAPIPKRLKMMRTRGIWV